MVTLQPFIVSPFAFHTYVVQPMFGDILDGNGVPVPSDEEGDWMVVDSPKHRVPIIDIFGGNNLIKRRDATCKLIYSPVAKLGKRFISDEELYAATEDCQEEFYQGCFEDYEQQNWEIFGEQIMPIMSKGVATDIYTNKYFGDITRTSDPNGLISWNKFDGIWTQYLNYVSEGIVETPISIAAGTISAAGAVAVLSALYAGQDELLDAFDDADKAFYVNKKIYDAYGEWLLSGTNNGALSLSDLQAGHAKLYYKGIEVKWKRWNGVLKSLNGGTQAHAAILTLRGNFLYKTDSSYGGGPRRNEAVRVWYSQDHDVWKRQIHFRGGTQIAAPQHSVLAITSF
ncbi:MAG: hypothetical protein IPQ08_06365 [Chitinophagaceae bacterium]|nr:hypothetical protein [Chitinophagaceae bacterium]